MFSLKVFALLFGLLLISNEILFIIYRSVNQIIGVPENL